MAASQIGLRDAGKGVAADADGGDCGVRWQQVACIKHGLGRGLEAVSHAHDEGAERRLFQRAVADEIMHQRNVAGIEQLDLGAHARLMDDLGHAPHICRCVDDDLPARIHRVEIERADFRTQQRDMLDAFFGGQQRRAGSKNFRVFIGGHEAPAGTGGDIEDDVRVAVADARDHILVIGDLHGWLAGARLAHMQMHDGRAHFRRAERRIGDFLGRDRQKRRLLRQGEIAGDRAGDEDLVERTAHENILTGPCRHRWSASCRSNSQDVWRRRARRLRHPQPRPRVLTAWWRRSWR